MNIFYRIVLSGLLGLSLYAHGTHDEVDNILAGHLAATLARSGSELCNSNFGDQGRFLHGILSRIRGLCFRLYHHQGPILTQLFYYF